MVTLYTRVWIEIMWNIWRKHMIKVTLYTRVWIEIRMISVFAFTISRHPLHEGVD